MVNIHTIMSDDNNPRFMSSDFKWSYDGAKYQGEAINVNLPNNSNTIEIVSSETGNHRVFKKIRSRHLKFKCISIKPVIYITFS